MQVKSNFRVYLHHGAWLKHTRCGRELNQTILALKTLLKNKICSLCSKIFWRMIFSGSAGSTRPYFHFADSTSVSKDLSLNGFPYFSIFNGEKKMDNFCGLQICTDSCWQLFNWQLALKFIVSLHWYDLRWIDVTHFHGEMLAMTSRKKSSASNNFLNLPNNQSYWLLNYSSHVALVLCLTLCVICPGFHDLEIKMAGKGNYFFTFRKLGMDFIRFDEFNFTSFLSC